MGIAEQIVELTRDIYLLGLAIENHVAPSMIFRKGIIVVKFLSSDEESKVTEKSKQLLTSIKASYEKYLKDLDGDNVFTIETIL